jgi:hypothetical protein
MIESLPLVAVAIILLASALTVGWALGQGLCRRTVRTRLWMLFYDLDTQEPAVAGARHEILKLIRQLEI